MHASSNTSGRGAPRFHCNGPRQQPTPAIGGLLQLHGVCTRLALRWVATAVTPASSPCIPRAVNSCSPPSRRRGGHRPQAITRWEASSYVTPHAACRDHRNPRGFATAEAQGSRWLVSASRFLGSRMTLLPDHASPAGRLAHPWHERHAHPLLPARRGAHSGHRARERAAGLSHRDHHGSDQWRWRVIDVPCRPDCRGSRSRRRAHRRLHARGCVALFRSWLCSLLDA